MTFFVVDVETTSTSPDTGALLTIGAVAVKEHELEVLGDFYVRLTYGVHHDTLLWNADTRAFWNSQDDYVRGEAYEDDRLVRHTPTQALRMLVEFVHRFGSVDDVHENVFVANPASFDHAWIISGFDCIGIPSPFSHRTMCLRSLSYGWHHTDTWRGHRPRFNKPTNPHHALDDAHAQALDLIQLLSGGDA